MVYAQTRLSKKKKKENETLKILWDFEIKTDHPVPARRPDLALINQKKNPTSWGLAVRANQRIVTYWPLTEPSIRDAPV